VSLIEAIDVRKEFAQPGGNVVALEEVSVGIEPGEFVGVTGESGSGKTTLLSLLGGIDKPTRGDVMLNGEAFSSATPERLARIRLESIGFVFQEFHLVRHLSALDNVKLPLFLAGRKGRDGRPMELLRKISMEKRAGQRPGGLSRGEMQRVAIARSLVNEPVLLLADEPTANLDRRNSEAIWELLHDLNREEGLTVVVATHNRDLLRGAGRTILLDDGKVMRDDSR
jgi:putative ABC transport system ATP-binding protein